MRLGRLFVCLFVGILSTSALAQQSSGPASGAPAVPAISNAPGSPTTRSSGTRPLISNQADKPTAEKPAAEKPTLAKEAAQPPPSHGEQPNDFQEFVAGSLGRSLPMFGYNLFDGAPSTFAPVDRVPVTPDYVIGPGDEVVIRAWGQVDIDYRAVVDRTGAIHIPQIGSLTVAGLRYQDLHGFMRSAIGRIFRNFDLNVSLGELRSIQVLVVGQARRPGAYTVSSLSTLINALFASGGPSSKGSMRRIQLKRGDQIVTEFDVYDLLIRGDKSKDVRLLPGDVIYIPPVGSLVAISGSVNTPAIFELKANTSLADLIALSGGLTTTAAGQKVTVERIDDRTVRKVDEFTLDATGSARPLRDGDVISVFAVSPRFENAVRLQGHVASPSRYPWRQGMRVTDLLIDKNALIPAAYWDRQNRGQIASDNTREINWDYAIVQRLEQEQLTTRVYAFSLGKAIRGDEQENMLLQPGDIVTVFSGADALPKSENDVSLQGSVIGTVKQRFVWREGMRISELIPDARWLIDYYNYWSNLKGGGLRSDINWDYANIVRQQPADLTKTIVAFDLGKAVLEKDPRHNMVLRPGDEITIFSKEDVAVPVSKQGVYVRAEGEVNKAGVHRAEPGETLRQFVVRVGGLAPNAYLFGTEFTRESTRTLQQKRLDEAVEKLETEMQQSALQRAQSALSADSADLIKAQAVAQTALIAKMRQSKATGRIVLEIPPGEAAVRDLPDLILENGDRLFVPPMPGTVGVLGRVYNPNTFIYRRDKTLGEYLTLAGGPTRDADAGGIFVLKADGSTVSKRRSGGFTRFEAEPLMPGDTIVVPEDFGSFNLARELKDWTQIFYQFALGVAGLKVLKGF